jgi:hypothetical protein
MKNQIFTLQKILNKARMSPMLSRAIKDTIQALEAQDLALACELSACKSFIIGFLDPKNKQYAFQEDNAYNKIALKDSVYCLLDNIHHDIAWKIGQLPSGMMIVGRGTIQEMKPSGTHPIVKRIIFEQNRVHKHFTNRRS